MSQIIFLYFFFFFFFHSTRSLFLYLFFSALYFVALLVLSFVVLDFQAHSSYVASCVVTTTTQEVDLIFVFNL